MLALALMLNACAEPAPEYRTEASGSKWKLLAFGEQSIKLDSAALVQLNVEVFLNQDSAIRLNKVRFAYTEDDLWRAFSNIYVGDSIEFHSVSPDILRPKDAGSDTIVYHIGIERMRSRRQLEDARLVELSILDSLVKSDAVQTHYTEHKGIWSRVLSHGDTSLVREGREVVLHYQGRTLSGNVFDDSRMQDGPLRFVMGQEHQVIPGIELGLERMHRGEVRELIIPSWLAFGSKGSVGGLVAPYTTVVYKVEVVALSAY